MLKAKQGRVWAKPRSAFAYVLGHIRIFRRWNVILPSAKCVRGVLHGLLRTFVTVHSKFALQVRRREPFTFTMLKAATSVKRVRMSAGSYYSYDADSDKDVLCAEPSSWGGTQATGSQSSWHIRQARFSTLPEQMSLGSSRVWWS